MPRALDSFRRRELVNAVFDHLDANRAWESGLKAFSRGWKAKAME